MGCSQGLLGSSSSFPTDIRAEWVVMQAEAKDILQREGLLDYHYR